MLMFAVVWMPDADPPATYVCAFCEKTCDGYPYTHYGEGKMCKACHKRIFDDPDPI